MSYARAHGHTSYDALMEPAGAVHGLGYRRELDGIRAVAIGFVMVFHGAKPWLPGGGIGVDIFFVLSGFLITTLLVEEFGANGRLHKAMFYARRALRLFPALYAMLAVVGIYSLVQADPDLAHHLRSEILTSGLYVNNLGWLFGVQDTWLYHTWSLAVEEQFYLIWPLILGLFLSRNWLRPLTGLVVGFMILAFVGRLTGMGHAVWVQRPDALAAGCLAALGLHQWPRWRSRISDSQLNALALACIGALALAALVIARAAVFERVGYSAVSVLAAALIVCLVETGGGPLGRLLRLEPVVWVGRISYGIYLWHLPVFKWFVTTFPTTPGVAAFPIKAGIAVAIAAVSYRFVEQPALRLKKRLYPSPSTQPAVGL